MLQNTINVSLVTDLIKRQFPQWSHLQIIPVKYSGWDNRTFRLGKELLIRLPSSQEYAAQVHKEQKWLPLLAPQLSIPIPCPVALGRPSSEYPFHWSIYKWIEGESVNTLDKRNLNLKIIALQLAQFLNELHEIDTTNGPLPGTHNFYRGASPKIYDNEVKLAIAQLKDSIDIRALLDIWNLAISTTWNKKPLWIHGDVSAGNILIKETNSLAAVIDFGCMGTGDPACDLVISWTLLKDESRSIFKSNLNLDFDTWARARGWALWKALITLVRLDYKDSLEAINQHRIIQTIIDEHKDK